MRKMNELLKRVFSLIVVATLVVTGVPTVAFYAETTVEKQEEILSDATMDEGSSETNSLEEKIEKEDILEEYQQYVEDGTYEDRVAFMQKLETQNSNHVPKATTATTKEDATAEQSQTMPYGGLMPSTGEVKALVFLVDFPDCRQTDGMTAEQREEELFFGYGQTFAGFYNNSSYGKLKLDGDVYGYYTAENNREYYNNPNAESIGRQELINELLEYYDDEIDYSDYDADKDGYIDALYIEYVGQDSGWGSFWWSYMTTWDVFVEQTETDGVLVHRYVWMNESTSNEDTYKHETGHLLGLIDYYDSTTGLLDGAIGTFDMMYGNMGDHNALSKILLGWIDPIVVNDVTQLELRSSQLYPDAAIVYPNKDKTSDEFFVVEYVTSDAANYQLSSLLDDGGIRVWRVNTKLTDDGNNYAYNNDFGSKKFIEAVGICNYSNPNQVLGNLMQFDIDDVDDMYDGKKINLYYSGDELTPYSTPSSYIYGDSESFYGPFTTSGIVMNDIVITGTNATVQISYEDVIREDFEYSLEYSFESAFIAELTFDYEVSILDENKISVSNGEKEIAIETEIMYLPDSGFKKMYIYSVDKYELVEEGIFTLSIESGALINVFGKLNPSISEEIGVISIESTLIKEFAKEDVFIPNQVTDMYTIDDEAYFFSKYKNELSLIRVYQDAHGLLTMEDIIIFENVDLSYIRAQKYGEKLLLSVLKNQNEWGVFCVYEVNTNGSYVLLYEEALLDGFIPNTYVLEENVIIERKDSDLKLILTGEVKELENTASNKLQGIWAIGTDQFVAVYYDKILLVDSKFNIVKEIDKKNISQKERVVDIFEKDGYITFLLFEKNGTNNDVSLVYYDGNLEYVKREKIISDTHNTIECIKGMDMCIEYEDGYIIRMEKSNVMMRFSNVFAYQCIGGAYINVTEFAFFDKEMNYVTSKVFWGRYYGSVCPAIVGGNIVYYYNGLYLEIYALDDVSFGIQDRKVECLELSKQNLMLSVGDEYQLSEKYEPYNAIAEFVWKSSDEDVAIVDDTGLVKIVGPGTATITVTLNDGSGMTANCEIIAEGKSEELIDVSTLDIVSPEDQIYAGVEITPEVTITDGSKVLVKDTDYTVTYSNNVNAGTATVTITGKGNYSGTKTATFTITSKSLTNATVSTIANQIYTGSAITPSVTVTDGSAILVKDTDYTVTYSNNINAGTATVTITGKGNYSGTKTVNFTIVKKEEPKPQVPTQITSPNVNVNESTGSISKITIGTSVQSFKAGLNETNYVKVYQNNQVVSDSAALATGMQACVMDGNTVVKKYDVIVTGDTNGDGKMNITDMIAIKANILKKTLLNGVYEDAGDVNGDGKINVTDFIKIKATLLKKDTIVGVAVK